MRKRQNCLASLASVAITAALSMSTASAQSVDTARIESGGQNDWLTYHGSYKGYHYSPLQFVCVQDNDNASGRCDDG